MPIWISDNICRPMAPGQKKKKKKVVIKVVKKKAKKDKKPNTTDELGSGTQLELAATLPGQLSAADAFDHYAVSCVNLDKHRLSRQSHHLD